MSYFTTIGRCSLCGGDVQFPNGLGSTSPAIPTCNQCGAIKREPPLPLIDMVQPTPKQAPPKSSQ